MAKGVSSFQFRSGDRVNSEFTERLEAVRSQTAKNTPGMRHVGLKIKQTPQGWTAAVDPVFVRAATPSWLQITRRPNPNSTADAETIAASYFVSWGTLNDLLPDNIDAAFTLPASEASRHMYIEAALSESSPFYVSSVELVDYATAQTNENFGTDGTWPDKLRYRLGIISRDAEGKLTTQNVGNGSMWLTIYTLGWTCSASTAFLRMGARFDRMQ